MAKAKKDTLQGTLDLLILKTLMRGPMHGYAIAVHITRVSEDTLRVEEGSLYPALHRLEQIRLLNAEWGTSETGRRAKFYKLAPAGRKQLEVEEQEWARLTRGVGKVLRYA